MGEADLIVRVPQLVKVCSSRFVVELVKRALPGLALTHLPRRRLRSPQSGKPIFAINRSGPCWENIMQTRKAGVHVPGDIPSPEMSLIVLLDDVR